MPPLPLSLDSERFSRVPSTLTPDIGIAKRSAWFVYVLLGADHDHSPYTQTGERIARIAAGGIRFVIGDLRTDATKIRKDGSRGRLRYDYGDHRDPQAAIAWLWKFIDAAKTAGELYGRALVVIAAEQYATRLVVPASQRMPATRWSSHEDISAKALRKLTGPHAHASLTDIDERATHPLLLLLPPSDSRPIRLAKVRSSSTAAVGR